MQWQWWCFTRQEPWSWSWQPLLGVWAMVGLLAWGYWRLRVSLVREGGEGGGPWWRPVSFGAGLFLLWISMDWPVGPLGASYFASLHMAQYVAVGVAAPALLFLGLPAAALRRLEGRPGVMAVLRAVTHPLVAFCLFNGVMTLTHWPSVVDTLMPTQMGSFVLGASWMVAGLVFWWPVLAPVPERPGFTPLARIGYLALNAFLIRPPFAMMIFSEDPVFRIYELAPPPAGDPMDDQQLGGVIMKIGVAWVMFAGVAAIFLQWVRSDDQWKEEGHQI
ncbi:MAG: cytochrome c oxidase assembly protein [Longimicrobiales bacterium]|nr:cytochrome c oxidase assembly protein [Longimicrobiales bacterium]